MLDMLHACVHLHTHVLTIFFVLPRRDWGNIRGLVKGKQRALKGWCDLAPESRRTLAQRTFPLWVALKCIAGDMMRVSLLFL